MEKEIKIEEKTFESKVDFLLALDSFENFVLLPFIKNFMADMRSKYNEDRYFDFESEMIVFRETMKLFTIGIISKNK